MSEEKPSQSISIRGGQVPGQVGMAGHDATFIQQGYQTATPEKLLTPVEVVGLLTQIEELLHGANLPEPEKKKAIKYLDAAKEEAQQKKPDKDLAAKSLKRMSETLKAAGETVEAGKGLWEKVQPILVPLLSWLGVAKSFFGL